MNEFQTMIVEQIIQTLLTFGIPLLIGAVIVWLQGRPAREQKWAMLGGQVAKEAVLLAEKSGKKGYDKLEMAIDLFNSRMVGAGKTYTPAAAVEQIQAAHEAMTLDKTTAYNDKTMTTDDAPMR